jgi:pre-mRNA cleavage complex 2 protein Pcf11
MKLQFVFLSFLFSENVVLNVVQVQPAQKLPVIYLMDSIVKVVGREYRTLFARNLYKTFTEAYMASDSAIKHKLARLIPLWNNIFPADLLKSLERFVGAEPKKPLAAPAAPVAASANGNVRPLNVVQQSSKPADPRRNGNSTTFPPVSIPL